jgi:hypothetical protein
MVCLRRLDPDDDIFWLFDMFGRSVDAADIRIALPIILEIIGF